LKETRKFQKVNISKKKTQPSHPQLSNNFIFIIPWLQILQRETKKTASIT